MKPIVRTVYGSALQSRLLLGLPYVHVENTTLNEKFEIEAGSVPANGEIPRARYYCIGIGGHRHANGADGRPYTAPIPHNAGDAALYDHVPFLLREVGNDLDPVTRQKYALRKQVIISGTPYIAYYLKRLDLTDAEVTMLFNTVVDGVDTTAPFVPTGANLAPTHPAIPATGAVSTEGDYLSSSTVLRLDFSEQDVAELVNVVRLMFDNELYAVISEIGVVAAVDKLVTASGPTGTFNYQEAIAAQIVAHVSTHYPVTFTNQGFDIGLEMGSTEPLMTVSA